MKTHPAILVRGKISLLPKQQGSEYWFVKELEDAATKVYTDIVDVSEDWFIKKTIH